MKEKNQVTKYSLIVPFYNEEGNINSLFCEIEDVFNNIESNHECVFVDDGSTDHTAQILDELANEHLHVKVVHLARNFGQTAAMSAAIDHSSGEIIIGLDGDRQNDPSDIPRMLSKLEEGYDVVSGWRKERKDKTLTRKIPSVTANWVISRVSGVPLHDYGCSLKIYRRQVIKDVRLYGEMHRFIPIYTFWMGGKVAEIQVNHRPRVAGYSKYGLNRIFKVTLDLLLVKFLDKYMTKPIHFFGGFGLASIFSSCISWLTSLYLKIFEGISLIETPLLLLGSILFVVGIQLIMMGILAEILVRTYFEGQSKRTYLVKRTRNWERSD